MLNKMKRGNKKSVSPVIATVLLISIVVVVSLLIFIWASNFFGEVGKKLGKSAEQVCGEINLDAGTEGTVLSVINNGNVPIYSIDVAKTGSGSIVVQNLEKIGLGQGDAQEFEIGSGYDEIELTPIILVQVKNGQEPYSCNKNKINVPI